MSSPGAASQARDLPDPLAEAADLVLLVDDEPLLLRSLRRILQADGHDTALAESLEQAEPLLVDPNLSVVLLDLFLGSTSGLDLLERLKRERPEVEVIMMTGHASIESAVGCIRRGAFDYLAKPFDDIHRVRTTVRKALERRRLVRRNHQLEEELRERAPTDLVGNSPPMRFRSARRHRVAFSVGCLPSSRLRRCAAIPPRLASIRRPQAALGGLRARRLAWATKMPNRHAGRSCAHRARKPLSSCSARARTGVGRSEK